MKLEDSIRMYDPMSRLSPLTDLLVAKLMMDGGIIYDRWLDKQAWVLPIFEPLFNRLRQIGRVSEHLMTSQYYESQISPGVRLKDVLIEVFDLRCSIPNLSSFQTGIDQRAPLYLTGNQQGIVIRLRFDQRDPLAVATKAAKDFITACGYGA